MSNQTLYLATDTPRSAEVATQIVGELIRQGVAFQARSGRIDTHDSPNSVPGLVVTVTGY